MTADGTPADRFAIEHAHYREDLPMWTALAERAAGPVLDLGAAVGRVSLALAVAGREVVAVDADPAMIAELERQARAAGLHERIRAVCADVRTLRLGQAFDLVLAPMNTMQVLMHREDQLAALRSVRDHLAPDGEFVFDVILPDLSAMDEIVGTMRQTASHNVGDGRTLVHHARIDAIDHERGDVRFTLIIDEIGPDGARRFERPHLVHTYSPTELWELATAAGLTVHAVYGDFDGSPLDEMSERQIFRCGADR